MDNDKDPWHQVYNLIVEGHSRLGAGIERLDRRLGGIDARLEGIDTRLNGMELVAEQRDLRYMGEFEDLRRRLGNRLALEEGSTTPPPATPPAPRRKRSLS